MFEVQGVEMENRSIVELWVVKLQEAGRLA